MKLFFTDSEGRPGCCIENIIKMAAVAGSKVCRLCKKKITEATYGMLRGRLYHLDEFLCSHCGRGLEHSEAVEDETTGALYCSDCHNEHMVKKCEACGTAVFGTAVEALGKIYHPHHFVCSRCKKLLEANYFKNEDQPVCQECFETRKKGNLSVTRKL